jgi:hypothetical protein
MKSPANLVVDMEKDTRSLIYDSELRECFPTLAESFKATDDTYAEDSEAYFANLIRTPLLSHIRQDATAVYNSDTSKANEALVIFAPFSDGAPQSHPRHLATYVEGERSGFAAKEWAQPHSWNQTTKSACTHDVMDAEGYGMPVVTLFSPLHKFPFDSSKYRKGDFTPGAFLVHRAIERLNEELHDSPKIDRVHFYGPSLGASNAIGAASEFKRQGWDVGSVTAQELIMGPSGIPNLANRFLRKQTIGEPSDTEVSEDDHRIPEPLMRREIDAHGNEIEMFGRMIRGMLKISPLVGLTKPYRTARNVDMLTAKHIPVTIASAVNSGLSNETMETLRCIAGSRTFEEYLHTIDIEAVEGQRLGHLVNEHVAVSATVALTGIARAAAIRS